MTVEKFADIPADDVRNRLRSADQLLAWLAGELVDRAGNVDQVRPDKSGKAPNRVGRLSMQMSRAVELVRLAVEQVDLHRDLGLAWVLLEQSRQQVGWAAEGLWLIGGSPRPMPSSRSKRGSRRRRRRSGRHWSRRRWSRSRG